MPKRDNTDPDLPGDADFRPAPATEVRGGVIFQLIPKSIEEQQAIHHNQLRYVELGKLRRGQPNLYGQTRYRS